MKKILSLAAAVMVLTAPAFAAPKADKAEDAVKVSKNVARPANELAVSYGVVTIPEFAIGFGVIFGSAFSFGLAVPDKLSYTGAFSLEYYRYLTPHVAVGGMVDWDHCMCQFKAKNGKDEEGNPEYKPSNKKYMEFVSILPAAKFPWFNRNHFGMYSKLAAGCALIFNSERTPEGAKVTPEDVFDATFSFQVNPIGMEFGGTNVRGFMELGWGMQGLIMGGIKYAF